MFSPKALEKVSLILKVDRLHNLSLKFKLPTPFYPQLDLILPPYKKLEKLFWKLIQIASTYPTPRPTKLFTKNPHC